jgi:hypothetical protein
MTFLLITDEDFRNKYDDMAISEAIHEVRANTFLKICYLVRHRAHGNTWLLNYAELAFTDLPSENLRCIKSRNGSQDEAVMPSKWQLIFPLSVRIKLLSAIDGFRKAFAT